MPNFGIQTRTNNGLEDIQNLPIYLQSPLWPSRTVNSAPYESSGRTVPHGYIPVNYVLHIPDSQVGLINNNLELLLNKYILVILEYRTIDPTDNLVSVSLDVTPRLLRITSSTVNEFLSGSFGASHTIYIKRRGQITFEYNFSLLVFG